MNQRSLVDQVWDQIGVPAGQKYAREGLNAPNDSQCSVRRWFRAQQAPSLTPDLPVCATDRLIPIQADRSPKHLS
jgi:hypothetical protein